MTVKIFLSWTRADETYKDALLERLWPNLGILAGLDFQWWEDTHLCPGEEWFPTLLSRLEEADYGLLLLSPAFFASDFITRFELPRFVGQDATQGALPVMLRQVPRSDPARMLHGVENVQIFSQQGRSFAELRGASRDRFALDLATRIRERIIGSDGWRAV